MEIKIGKIYRTNTKDRYFYVTAIEKDNVWGYEIAPEQMYISCKSYIGHILDYQNLTEVTNDMFLDKFKRLLEKLFFEYQTLKHELKQ